MQTKLKHKLKMKRYILTLLSVILIGFTANAQNINTNILNSGKQSRQWELTLGGGGESINHQSTFGLDLSLSTNPLKHRPEVWFGVAQGVYWQPTFAGSTDLFVDWSQAILPSKLNDRLYFNVGWSGGALYDIHELSQWRTGPEFTAQVYVTDSSFIFAGTNYDLWTNKGSRGTWRYSFGIGLAF